MTDTDHSILQRVTELQRELDRIYASTLDINHPDLLAVSREINELVVEYLRNHLVAPPPEQMANDP